MKIGILASHPIQYQAPIFRELARHAELRVFFAHRQSAAGQANAGYGTAFEWDIDLLHGYESNFLENIASRPDTARFLGCNTPAIFAAVRQGDFDAFIVTGWNLLSYWQAVMACRLYRVPVLVRGDSHLETPRSTFKKYLKSLLYPLLLKCFSGFLYVGRKNREYLAHYGVGDNRLFFSPHSVDNAWFAEQTQRMDRALLRTEWHVESGKRIVLFVGRLVSMKRLDDLLEALCLLMKAGLDIQGVIVGDGPLRPVLEEHARKSGIDITFAGFRNQSQLPALYKLADVLVLPSGGGETWGLVVNESLACGTPVVVSDSAGCSADLAADGSTGEVFPTGNVEALAAALSRVLARQPDQAGIKQWVEAYSVQASVAGIIAGCKHFMNSQSGSRG